jgi:hypothetical protein
MKYRTAASTILFSLAAVAGCNNGDAGYVRYNQTSTSEFEESQNQQAILKQNSPTEVDAPPQDTAQALPTNSDSEGGLKTPTADVAKTDSGNNVVVLNPTTSTSIVSAPSGISKLADTQEIDNSAVAVPNKIELLIAEKSFRRERGTEAVRISYDDIDLLKVLNMEPVPPNAVEYFPEWLAGLDGKRVRIRGWMYPTFVSEGLTSFTLARDNGICCFQRMPKIYDVIFVKLEKGQSTNYIDQRPFDVEGTFMIDNEGDGSDLPRLYKIENARVLD